MKHRFLFAIFLVSAGFSLEARPKSQGGNVVIREEIVLQEVGYVLPDSVNTLTASQARALAPVAERISRRQLANPRPTYSGILPRMAAVGHPAEMVSPFAPRRYGAGWNLMSFTNRDPYLSVTPNTNTPIPTGLRVLGVRGIW